MIASTESVCETCENYRVELIQEAALSLANSAGISLAYATRLIEQALGIEQNHPNVYMVDSCATLSAAAYYTAEQVAALSAELAGMLEKESAEKQEALECKDQSRFGLRYFLIVRSAKLVSRERPRIKPSAYG